MLKLYSCLRILGYFEHNIYQIQYTIDYKSNLVLCIDFVLINNMQKILICATAASVGLFLLYYFKKMQQIQRKSILDYIGNTPLIYLKTLSQQTGCEIYAKAEFMNPFGSSKDRAAKYIIQEAEKNKMFQNHREIIEASSAQISRILGINTKIFLPNDLAKEKYSLLEILGAEIVKVPPVSIVDPNHFCNLAMTESVKCGTCFSNQFQNLSNMHAHYKTTGPEIYKQTKGKLDAFICSAGTGGTLAGVSQFLKEKKKSIKIILADPQGSGLHNKIKFGTLFSKEQKQGYRKKNPFDSITEGIGLNRNTENFAKAIIDDSYKISDLQALHLSRYLIHNEGLFLGSSSSVNLAAAVKYARNNKGSCIVTILHDSGNRYLSKFYSDDYLKKLDIPFEQHQSYPPQDLSFIL